MLMIVFWEWLYWLCECENIFLIPLGHNLALINVNRSYYYSIDIYIPLYALFYVCATGQDYWVDL